MVDIDEYGEIKEKYGKSNGFSLAKEIALADARKDLREPKVDTSLRFCHQIGNCYSIVVDGFDRFDDYAWITYLIDKYGHIKERKIEHLEDLEEPIKDKRGCIIITACCGEISQEVQISRFFRDNFLEKNFSGRLAIDGYYKISPYIVNKMKQFKILKKLVKSIIVNPIVVFEEEKIRRNFTIKKILSSFIYYPCIFIITIAGMLSQRFKSY